MSKASGTQNVNDHRERAVAVVPSRALAKVDPRAGEAHVSLSMLAQEMAVPPRLLERFASFAVADCFCGPDGFLCFPVSVVPRLVRAVRLYYELRVGASSLGLVLDLLDRIDALEADVHRLRSG